jgi:hypothetical protein
VRRGSYLSEEDAHIIFSNQQSFSLMSGEYDILDLRRPGREGRYKESGDLRPDDIDNEDLRTQRGGSQHNTQLHLLFTPRHSISNPIFMHCFSVHSFIERSLPCTACM